MFENTRVYESMSEGELWFLGKSNRWWFSLILVKVSGVFRGDGHHACDM